MNSLEAIALGKICVTVYQTSDGKRFFYLKADNENILPIVDILEDTLFNY